MPDARTTATEVTAALGGSDNVLDVENCITRLRVTVREVGRVDEPTLRGVDGVLGVVVDDTVQVVLGPGRVNDVARAMADTGPAAGGAAPTEAGTATTAVGISADALHERGEAIRSQRKARNQTPVKVFLRRVSNIFLPLIPALVACGIIAGLNGVLTNLVARGDTPWATAVVPVLAAISNGFMTLIAVFVGINAAKEFGGTPVLGGAVAAIIPFAGVAKITVMGEKLAPGQGGVIGALLAAVLAAYLERWARRWCPPSLSMLVVPTFVVLVAGVLTIVPLMTLSGRVAGGIGGLANGLLAHGGLVAGLLLAGLFLPLVMLGLHQALIPIHTTLIQQAGYTVLLPILAMAGAGQVGAALALYVRLKHNESIRATIRSALPAGFLGVGEPLIYGVTLPLGRPFVTACIGGAAGGGFVGLFHQLGISVGSTAIGPSGWALFPLTTGNHGIGAAVAVYAGGLVVGYVAGFLATYFWGLSREDLVRLDAPQASREVADAVTSGPR